MVFWYMKPTKQHPLGGPSLLLFYFVFGGPKELSIEHDQKQPLNVPAT